MPITSPNTLPQDFAPSLAEMMLRVPQKDLLFARWLNAAMAQAEAREVAGSDMNVLESCIRAGAPMDEGAMANVAEAMNFGQGGAALGANGLLAFPDFFRFVKSATGRGTSVLINRPKFLTPDTTIATRKLTADGTFFGNDPIALENEQVNVRIDEVVGPVVGGSRRPIGIDLFTERTAFHALCEQAKLNLVFDRNSYLHFLVETLIAAAYTATGQVVRGGDKASNASFVTQGADPFTFDLLTKAEEQFQNVGVPGLNGMNKWVVVLHQHQIMDLKNDPVWQRQTAYQNNALNPIFPGFVAEAGNFIVCMSNNLTTLSSIGAGNNLTGYVGYALAPGFIGHALNMNARLLRDKNDDGGRTTKVGWHAFEGVAALDDRMVVGIVTT